MSLGWLGCGAAPARVPQSVEPETETEAKAPEPTCYSREETRRLVVDWPQAERAVLQSAKAGGAIAARDDGCRWQLLPECRGRATYTATRFEPVRDTVAIRSQESLASVLPLSADALKPELDAVLARGSLEVALSTTVYLSASLARELPIEGNCTGATHVVTGVSLGDYALSVEVNGRRRPLQHGESAPLYVELTPIAGTRPLSPEDCPANREPTVRGCVPTRSEWCAPGQATFNGECSEVDPELNEKGAALFTPAAASARALEPEIAVGTYRGAAVDVITRYREETKRTVAEFQRLHHVWDEVPVPKWAIRSVCLQGDLFWKLSTGLRGTQPPELELFDAPTRELLERALSSGNPQLRLKAQRTWLRVAAAWDEARAKELRAADVLAADSYASCVQLVLHYGIERESGAHAARALARLAAVQGQDVVWRGARQRSKYPADMADFIAAGAALGE